MNKLDEQTVWDAPSPVARPAVVTWFRVYAAFMLVIYLALTAVGVLMLARPDLLSNPDAAAGTNAPSDVREATIMGAVYLVLGPVLALAFVVPLVLRRGKVAWVWSLVLICIGSTSVCCLPATIPLLIFWIRQETRDWFYGSA